MPSLKPRERAYCRRCDDEIGRGEAHGFQINLAMSMAVLVLLFVANYFPIMSLELEGQQRATTVIEGVEALWRGDRIETALLVLAVTVIIPIVRAFAVIYVTVPLLLGHPAWRRAGILRFVTQITPWGMTEVYLLGALVAFVKLGDLATVFAGPAMFAFAALSILSAFSTSHLEGDEIWVGAPKS